MESGISEASSGSVRCPVQMRLDYGVDVRGSAQVPRCLTLVMPPGCCCVSPCCCWQTVTTAADLLQV